MKKLIDAQPVCEKCGALQRSDTNKSNANWQVFDSHERCECGGKFVPSFLLKKMNIPPSF